MLNLKWSPFIEKRLIAKVRLGKYEFIFLYSNFTPDIPLILCGKVKYAEDIEYSPSTYAFFMNKLQVDDEWRIHSVTVASHREKMMKQEDVQYAINQIPFLRQLLALELL